MPLRTVEQYKDSLKDDRQVYFRGQRIPDVTGHPLVQTAIEHEATDYRLMHDPRVPGTWPVVQQPRDRRRDEPLFSAAAECRTTAQTK